MAERTRLGIFGGSFDPIHIGHLVAVENARFACALDKVLLVVAGEPWQKVGTRQVTDAEVRFAAVEAAVEGIEGLEASRIEIDRAGPSYTADTLAELRTAYAEADLYLIVGTDVAERLDTWEAPEVVAELAELVVVNRPGTPRPLLADKWRVHDVEMPSLDISSTDLRARLEDGRPVDFLIPAKAAVLLRRSGR